MAGARPGQPDGRAHRLQRRVRAPVRARPGRHGRGGAAGRAAADAVLPPGARGRGPDRARRAGAGPGDRLGRLPGRRRLGARGGRPPGAWRLHRDRLRPARGRRPVLLGRARVRGRAGPNRTSTDRTSTDRTSTDRASTDRTGPAPAGRADRLAPRAGRDRPAGRERVRRGALGHHGPVRLAAQPGRPRAAARLPLAGYLAGAVRSRRGGSEPAAHQHPGQARPQRRGVRSAAGRVRRSGPPSGHPFSSLPNDPG